MVLGRATSSLFPYTTLFRSCRTDHSIAKQSGSSTSASERTRCSPPLACAAGCAVHVEWWRSEEHTSELQSLRQPVCRLVLEKKKKRMEERTPQVESRRQPGD